MTVLTQAAPAANTLETLPANAAAALVHLAGTLHVLIGEAQRNAEETDTRNAANLAELARDAVTELHATFTALNAVPAANTLETLPANAAAALVHLAGTLHVLIGEAQRNAEETDTRNAANLAELARDAVTELHATLTALGAVSDDNDKANAPNIERMTTSAQEKAGLIPSRIRCNRRGETVTDSNTQAAAIPQALQAVLNSAMQNAANSVESENAAKLLMQSLGSLIALDEAVTVALPAESLAELLANLANVLYDDRNQSKWLHQDFLSCLQANAEAKQSEIPQTLIDAVLGALACIKPHIAAKDTATLLIDSCRAMVGICDDAEATFSAALLRELLAELTSKTAFNRAAWFAIAKELTSYLHGERQEVQA